MDLYNRLIAWASYNDPLMLLGNINQNVIVNVWGQKGKLVFILDTYY